MIRVGVSPEANAEKARRRDEAVRRLREESRRRIERGRGLVASRCLLGAVLSLTLFAALEARRDESQRAAALEEMREKQRQAAKARCAALEGAVEAIDVRLQRLDEGLLTSRTEAEVAWVRANAAETLDEVMRHMSEDRCRETMPTRAELRAKLSRDERPRGLDD